MYVFIVLESNWEQEALRVVFGFPSQLWKIVFMCFFFFFSLCVGSNLSIKGNHSSWIRAFQDPIFGQSHYKLLGLEPQYYILDCVYNNRFALKCKGSLGVRLSSLKTKLNKTKWNKKRTPQIWKEMKTCPCNKKAAHKSWFHSRRETGSVRWLTTVKALAARPKDLSSISGIHIAESKNWLPGCPDFHAHTVVHRHTSEGTNEWMISKQINKVAILFFF